jgi:hypothetical protein
MRISRSAFQFSQRRLICGSATAFAVPVPFQPVGWELYCHHRPHAGFTLQFNGAAVFGNREKPRAARYSPFKDAQRLRNMTRCLVHRKTMRIGYDGRVGAGDLIAFASGEKLVVITAAHVFSSGTDDGGASDTYTRLWLGALEA